MMPIQVWEDIESFLESENFPLRSRPSIKEEKEMLSFGAFHPFAAPLNVDVLPPPPPYPGTVADSPDLDSLQSLLDLDDGLAYADLGPPPPDPRHHPALLPPLKTEADPSSPASYFTASPYAASSDYASPPPSTSYHPPPPYPPFPSPHPASPPLYFTAPGPLLDTKPGPVRRRPRRLKAPASEADKAAAAVHR